MLPQQIVLGHLNYETIIPILDKVKGLLMTAGLICGDDSRLLR